MNFKVGQRVWCKQLKRFGIVERDTLDTINHEYYLSINIENSPLGLPIKVEDLHETADDMFKELGYHIIKNDKDYLTYKTIYNYSIQFYKFNKEYFVGMYDDVFNQNTEGELCSITKEEHQAIHQKMIELGWIE